MFWRVFKYDPVQCIHLRFSLGFWPVPGVVETEVGHTEVVLPAVLLDADGVPGDEADVLREAAEALELGGGGGEAEDGAEVGPAGRQLHREPRLQAGQLVPDVGLKKVGFRHRIIHFFQFENIAMLRFVALAQGTGIVLILYIEQGPYLNVTRFFMSTKVHYF